MRLIDADEIIFDEMAKDFIVAFKHNIDNAPTVDAEPVRHARLVNAHPYGECSCCGELIDVRSGYNYCPHCGARMDGDEIN